eukprot:m.431915 g.431915  ORF g.431915 m.431915 type:complete len:357 (+) comp21407_c0_seq18:207-1277(+)
MASMLFTTVGGIAAAGAAAAFYCSHSVNAEFRTIKNARTMDISEVALLMKIRRPPQGAWVHVKGVVDIPAEYVQTGEDSAVAMLEQVYEDWVVCQAGNSSGTACHRERRNTKSELSALSQFDIKQYTDADVLQQYSSTSSLSDEGDEVKPLILSKIVGGVDLSTMKTALARAQAASNPRIAVITSTNIGLHHFSDGTLRLTHSEYAVNESAEEVAAFVTNAGSDTSSVTTLRQRLDQLPQVFPALQQGGSVHLGSLHEVWSLNKGDPVDVVGMACITPGETVVLDTGATPPEGAPQALYIARSTDDGAASVTSTAGKNALAHARSLPIANTAHWAGWVCSSVAAGAALSSVLCGDA